MRFIIAINQKLDFSGFTDTIANAIFPTTPSRFYGAAALFSKRHSLGNIYTYMYTWIMDVYHVGRL